MGILQSGKQLTAAADGWTAPAKPEAKTCACGGKIDAKFMEPLWLAGRLVSGTGDWQFEEEACAKCAESKRRALENAQKSEKIARAISDAGYAPKHLKMEFANYNGSPGTKKAFDVCCEFAAGGKFNLFLFGERGVGKTHLAAAAQKERIRGGGSGLFRNVSLMLLENRSRMMDGGDELDLVMKLVRQETLILDEIGLDKPTDWVIKTLYLLTEYWDVYEKTGLIFTSNLTIDEISKRVDDRVASRIGGMCRVVEMRQKDYRVSRGV